MSIDLPDWKTRLTLSVNGKLIPIRDKGFEIIAPKERIHIVQVRNVMWNHLPHEYRLTFTTFQLLDLGPFLANLIETDDGEITATIGTVVGDEWTFDSLGFGKGTISSLIGGEITASGVPIFTVVIEFLEWTPDPSR